MKKLFALLVVLSLTCGNYLLSQDKGELRAIQTVVPFLTVAPDSRAGGMGDAGVATSPDVYSMHWNPAKFAFIDGNGGIGISYVPWLRNLVPDINIANVAAYFRLDSRQVLSTSLLYSSLGTVPLTDDWGTLTREIIPNEFAFDAAYSRMFSDNFSGGLAFRFIYSNLTSGISDNRPGISVAADLSGYYQKDVRYGSKNGSLAFGVNFSNIGSKMSYSEDKAGEFIPMNFRIGSAATVELDDHNKLTATIDINKLLVPSPRADSNNVAVPVAIFSTWFDAEDGISEEFRELTFSPALEYWYNNQVAVRGGYFHENATKGNRKYFTAGLGLKLKVFAIDISYLMPVAHNHPLAQTLRFSLAFDFGNMRVSNPE
jgi:hypothetical protein